MQYKNFFNRFQQEKIFAPKNFFNIKVFHTKFFSAKIFSNKQTLPKNTVFRQTNFRTEDCFSTNLFFSKILHQKKFSSKYFLATKESQISNFNTNYFRTKQSRFGHVRAHSEYGRKVLWDRLKFLWAISGTQPPPPPPAPPHRPTHTTPPSNAGLPVPRPPPLTPAAPAWQCDVQWSAGPHAFGLGGADAPMSAGSRAQETKRGRSPGRRPRAIPRRPLGGGGPDACHSAGGAQRVRRGCTGGRPRGRIEHVPMSGYVSEGGGAGVRPTRAGLPPPGAMLVMHGVFIRH